MSSPSTLSCTVSRIRLSMMASVPFLESSNSFWELSLLSIKLLTATLMSYTSLKLKQIKNYVLIIWLNSVGIWNQFSFAPKVFIAQAPRQLQFKNKLSNEKGRRPSTFSLFKVGDNSWLAPMQLNPLFSQGANLLWQFTFVSGMTKQAPKKSKIFFKLLQSSTEHKNCLSNTS